jgi:hypothetical protein
MFVLFRQANYFLSEYLLENILRHGKVITFGILCETELNYLPLILQENLVKDVNVFDLFVA